MICLLFPIVNIPPKSQPGRNCGADSASKRHEPYFGRKCFVTQFAIKLQIGKHWKLHCEKVSCTRGGLDLHECFTTALQQAWACDVTAFMDISVGWNGGTSALEVWGIYPFQKEYYFAKVSVQFFHVFKKNSNIYFSVSHQRK